MDSTATDNTEVDSRVKPADREIVAYRYITRKSIVNTKQRTEVRACRSTYTFK